MVVQLQNTQILMFITVALVFLGAIALWAGLIHLSQKGKNGRKLPVIIGGVLLVGGVVFGMLAFTPVLESNAERVVSHYGIENVQRVGEGALTRLSSTDKDTPVIFTNDTYPENLGVLRVRDGEAQLMVSVEGQFNEYRPQ